MPQSKQNITKTDRTLNHDTTSKRRKTPRPHDSHNTTKAKQSSQVSLHQQD